MALVRMPSGLPKPHTQIDTGRGTLRFYLADCLDVLRGVAPGAISVIVTSPPYNLGVRYRSYDDTLPRDRYLDWTDAWTKAAARAIGPQGSLFLNVGAKPTDPWTALDVAQTARRHLTLQNTIHWIKSIAIDRDAAGASAGLDRDLSVGHYKPINSERFVNDCHEFIFHFSVDGQTPLDRHAIGVPYQDASNVTRWRRAAGNRRCRGNTWFVPYDDYPEPRPGPAAPRHLPAPHRRVLPEAPWGAARARRDGSVPRTREQRGRRRRTGRRLRRGGDRRALPRRSHRAGEAGDSRGRRVNLTQRRQGTRRASPFLRVRFAPLREPHSRRT